MNSSKTSRRNRRKKTKGATKTPSAPPPPGSAIVNTPDSELKREEEREEGEDVDRQTLDWLAEAFSLATIDEVNSAYREANCDPYRAAEILGRCGGSRVVDRRRKQKKVVTSTGLVSDVIGKGYARSGSFGMERRDCDEGNRLGERNYGRKEEIVEFLWSMLGDDCGLDAGVVSDVFGHCGHDVEMTLDMLLNMSASSDKQHQVTHCGMESIKNLKDRDKTSDSTYRRLEKGYEPAQSLGYASRVFANGTGSSLQQPSSLSSTTKHDLQQKVLESIFNIADNPKHEPNCMNWKKVVKKLEAFGPGLEFSSACITKPPDMASDGVEDSYHTARTVARQHWDAMRCYYQKAAVAYSKGERAHATYLSEQGKYFRKLGREADERAGREIFEAKNKNIQNVVTIDLHGQHVKQAMILLKFHVLMLTYSPAIRLLRVITGTGSHGVGEGKVKQSVYCEVLVNGNIAATRASLISAIGFLKKEGIEWIEENSGTLAVKVDRFKEYNFVTSDCDSE